MTHFEVYLSEAKQYRWRLRAANGETIADSGEGYTTKNGALNGITLVIRTNGKTKVEDLTAER